MWNTLETNQRTLNHIRCFLTVKSSFEPNLVEFVHFVHGGKGKQQI